MTSPPQEPQARSANATPLAEAARIVQRASAPLGADDYVIAIPAHNEELTIGSVVLRARQHGRPVVVVDDGSKDRTAELAAQAGARVILHVTNAGYGEALRTVFRTARAEGWNAVVLLDSDGQHNPDDVPAVVSPILAGQADVSIGSRFLEKATQDAIPAYRQVGIQVLTRLNNLGASKAQKVTDGQSGFRAFSRRAIGSIMPHDSDMGISAEILFQARKADLRFSEVPIFVRYDVDGSSQKPLKHGLGIIASMVRYVEVEHPLLCLALPGAALLFAGLFALGYGLLGGAALLALTLAGVGIALVGLITAFTGLILHAVIAATRTRAAA